MADKKNAQPVTFGFGRRDFLRGAAAAATLPMMAGLPKMAAAQDAVELLVWAWTPDTAVQAEMFMKKFPNIKVKIENQGGGKPHYDKLRNAIQAGSGLPDVAQMEFNSIPSFRALQALADMGPYGANDVKDKFIDWTWAAGSDGDAVYSIPWDSGPMGSIYRDDIYAANGLTPAKTWDEFAESAMKLATDKPGTFLTNFVGASDAGWLGSQFWQIGARPFHVNGEEIHIEINSQKAKDLMNYWQKLIDAKAVDTTPGWTTEWFAGMDEGKYATWIAAAWSPIVMQQSMKKSFGLWRAAPMPVWEAGKNVTSNWGGSTFSAFTTSQHLAEATQFAVFMGSDPEAARLWNTKQFLFPVLKELASDADLMGNPFAFYGDQPVNQVFAESLSQVDPTFEFAPFQDYADQILTDALAKAVGGEGTMADALDGVQDAVVAYAKDQGFTVI